ncbi:Carbonic anhydrase [Hypsizygus marmoreus]|uniref:Carbonic anhydrase n=1 Tax=Hypsizygus marmoreus TaxID=39966 RepID=A0A369JYT0_HYPMA|nr:Carbonic anhydrase [Hypsizygus marmoreus]
MLPGALLCLLLTASASLARPLIYRELSYTTPMTTLTSSTAPSIPTSTIPVNNATSASDLALLLDGNTQFRMQQAEQRQSLPDQPPRVMFIGCSDNRITTDLIFQSEPGSSISHLNLANRFSGKDPNSNAVVTYAIRDLGVKHIIVMGHYGCKSIQAAMSRQPQKIDKIVQIWIQPIIDIFSHSRRVEIKKLRSKRRASNIITATNIDSDAFRALVEENVKASVKNLMRESILFAEYHKKNFKSKKVEVFVHGLVFDEQTGEVKDLGVSFGPPGQVVPKAKAKMLDPTPTTTATSETSSTASSTSTTPEPSQTT